MVTVARVFDFFPLSTSLSLFLSGLTLHLIQVPSLSQQLSKEEEDNFPTTNSTQSNYHHRNLNLSKNPFQIHTKLNKN